MVYFREYIFKYQVIKHRSLLHIWSENNINHMLIGCIELRRVNIQQGIDIISYKLPSDRPSLFRRSVNR